VLELISDSFHESASTRTILYSLFTIHCSLIKGVALPFIQIHESPLAPDQNDIQLFYRQAGDGVPLIFLHGGWGYEIYPFDKQIEAFRNDFRILIPDRSGYGGSGRIEAMSADFHDQAAEEMLRFLNAMNIERSFLWGHSDGAVIATKMALAAPERCFGVILEAFHFYKFKPASQAFFETMMRDPAQLGERVTNVLAREHGENYWRKIIEINGTAWLKIAEASEHEKDDLYGGRISQLKTKTLFIHGKQDPRTEPDELAAVHQQLPHIPIRLIEGAKHSPHSENAAAQESIALAREFFESAG
jgi:pimeloyl-ACP methyl ester carboxylesterase